LNLIRSFSSFVYDKQKESFSGQLCDISHWH